MKKFFLVIILLLFFPSASKAARIYMEPARGEYGPGDDIEVDIKIDVLEACINTIEAEILFPNDYLNIREFTTGDSLISLWLEKPARADFDKYSSEGKMYFAGGIPGGYCGKIPGDPGESNIVGRIIFTIPTLIIAEEERDEVEISFSDRTRVLRNDGQGTADTLLKQSAVFKMAGQATNKDFDWRSRIESDDIPPEPFTVELHQNDNIFEGRYYLAFSAVDKQTGVDRFEILEIKPGEEIGAQPEQNFWQELTKKKREAPEWKTAKMPYPLSDQTLESIIKVKAVDKAGNERVVEYVPPAVNTRIPDNSSEKPFSLIIIAVAAVLALAGLLIFFYIKTTKRNNNYEEE